MAQGPLNERTRQQGRRLRTLRERTGISKGLLMDRLNFTTSKGYELYEDGVSVIRADRLEDWAAAFGLSVQAFVAEVITGDADPAQRERAAEALGPVWAGQMPATVEAMAEVLSKHGPAIREQVLAEVEAQRRNLSCGQRHD